MNVNPVRGTRVYGVEHVLVFSLEVRASNGVSLAKSVTVL